MKLTRRRIGQERKGEKIKAAFYRNISRGLLYLDSENCDYTECVVEAMDFERSCRGRILKNADNEKNPFYKIVKGLTDKDTGIFYEAIVDDGNDIDILINNNITRYGKELQAPGSTVSFEELIREIQSGTSKSEIILELEKIKRMIQDDIQKSKDRLIKSIANNRIPFSLQSNGLVPSSKKMKWLYKILDDNNILKKYWDKYEYEKLEPTLIKAIEDLQYKNARLISRTVSGAIRDYHRSLKTRYTNSSLEGKARSEHEINSTENNSEKEEFLLFLKAVEQHFKKYFPVKGKHSTDAYDKALCQAENYKLYCKFNFVKKEVNRSIMNQLVSGLIQHGKLIHYFNNDGTWDVDFLNSHGLSYIQVEEAFKKSLMASLSWGINRLTSFYYDINDTRINSNEESIVDDILLESKRHKELRRNYYNDLRSNDIKQKYFREKLAACYSIIAKDDKDKISDDINKLIGLVERIRKSVAHIRHSSFHYKKVTLPEMLNAVNINYIRVEEFFARDIENLYNAFREKIRSLGIVEYYSGSDIAECFEKCGIKFTLYSPQNSLIPSFKKIYKKGVNLNKGYRAKENQKEPNKHNKHDEQVNRKDLLWYLEIPNNEQGLLAYKNLLQIIYYHSFLPEVQKNELLITNFINNTKEWNRVEAKKISERRGKKNKSSKHNNEKDFKAYRYEAIPDYQGESLDDYLKIIQREQMAQANEMDEGTTDHNYYIRFMQDVVVWAFGDYLEKLMGRYRDFLQKPALQDVDIYDALEELLPEDKEKGKFPMACRFNMKTDENGNTIVYTFEQIKDQIKNRKDLLCFYLFLRLLDAREIAKLQHQFIRYRCSLIERRLPDGRSNQIEDEIELFKELEELMELVRYTIPEVHSLYGKKKSVFNVMIQLHFKEFFEVKALKNPEVVNLYYQLDKKTPIPRKHMALLIRSVPLPLYKNMFKNYYCITENDFKEYIQTSEVIEEIQNKQKELHKMLERARLKSPNIEKMKDKNLWYIEDKNVVEKVIEYEENLRIIARYNQIKRKITFESLYRIFQIHVDLCARLIGYTQDWERDMYFLLKSLENKGIIRNNILDRIFSGNIVRKLNNILNTNEKGILYKLCWHKELTIDDMYNKMDIRNSIAHLNHFTQSWNFDKPSLIEMINALRVLLHYDRKRQNAVLKTINDLLLKDYRIKIEWERKVHDTGEIKFDINGDVINEPIIHLKNIHKGAKCKVYNKAYMIEKQREWLCNGIREEIYDKNFLECIERLFKFNY